MAMAEKLLDATQVKDGLLPVAVEQSEPRVTFDTRLGADLGYIDLLSAPSAAVLQSYGASAEQVKTAHIHFSAEDPPV